MSRIRKDRSKREAWTIRKNQISKELSILRVIEVDLNED